MSLTKLSRKTRMPVSTLFDRIKHRYHPLKRYTCLLDFPKLGFDSRAFVLLKLERDKERCTSFLSKHHNVNTLFRVNNGWHVMAELVFPTMPMLEAFLELLDKKFTIEDRRVHYVLQEIIRERFFAEPDLVPLLFQKV